ERPSSGLVLFDGEPAPFGSLALRRRMAVVFQEPLLLDTSVRDNVETGLRLRGVPGPERRRRAGEWLGRFGVAHLAGRPARRLSGGEAQRVNLARAFAVEPDVLLLDEPFSALDQPTRDTLIDELADALGATGATCVLVTHDRSEAARLAGRVAVLLTGCIRQLGSVSDVFTAPVDEEVASFVGVETVVEGRVVGAAEGLIAMDVNGRRIEAAGEAPGFTSALVCVRPEDVALAPAGEGLPSGSARNRLPGVVRQVTSLGPDARVLVDCGFTLVARVTRRSLGELGIDVGSPVVASFKATSVHLIPLHPRH
ncbi:MAG TPA: ABC transporter ATP-binding protein, partial [Dehalococcoidia bacterium]|nr:ABC transporter ATP-binding protein [Dehalococcoidia bacterium]